MIAKRFVITLCLSVFSLSGATFNVSTTPELRTALTAAATNGEDDTIVLADGIYKTTDDRQGTFISIGSQTNSLTIEGSSADKVVLSGNNTDQILWYRSYNNSLLRLKNLSFIDGNNSTSDGGAVYVMYSIQVDNCKFLNNTAQNGGAIYTIGSYESKVKNSYFENNNALTNGGGFYSNRMYVEGSSFINNLAGKNGAGFYTMNYNFIKSNKFVNNRAGIDGGGFYISAADSSSYIVNSKFKDNFAQEKGGGFYFYTAFTSSSILVFNSIFINNNALEGGGIRARHLKLFNGLFIHNNSAINISDNGGGTSIYNSIFTNNTNDITGNALITANIPIMYNYINESSINILSELSNNIFEGINIEFLDENNDDFHLIGSSNLIDAGYGDFINTYNNVRTSFYPPLQYQNLTIKDINNTNRILGTMIDIGPYEYTYDNDNDSILDFDDPDDDNDGMPDTYEMQYGLDPFNVNDASLDLDGDGQMNFEEFTAGTNPNDANSKTYSLSLTEGWNFVALEMNSTVELSNINNQFISIVRSYQNNAWHSWTKENNATSDQPLTSLEDGYGYWIFALQNTSLEVIGNGLADQIPLDVSWNMRGSSNLTSMNDFFIDNPTVKIVWRFNSSTHEFEAISPDTNVQTELDNAGIQKITSVQANEALFIKYNLEFKGVEYKTVVSPTTGRVWLDRNLGATKVCASKTDESCYGDYYQWGRLTDGHQIKNSFTTSSQAENISLAGDKFVINNSDWQFGAKYVSGYWDYSLADLSGSKRTTQWSKTDGSSICPVSFRVPTKQELEAENDLDFLKLGYSGYRDKDAVLKSVSITGNIWSVNVDTSLNYSDFAIYTGETSAYSLSIADSVNSSIDYVFRSRGNPVRCIKK